MIKRIVSVISIICIMTIDVYWSSEDVYAIEKGDKQVAEYKSNASDLMSSKDENNAMNRVLKKNKNHKSGKMKDDIEQTLNEIGVFDEEIEDFPEELI